MRLIAKLVVYSLPLFQSTHRVSDATDEIQLYMGNLEFQSTHRVSDATIFDDIDSRRHKKFQSTHRVSDATLTYIRNARRK